MEKVYMIVAGDIIRHGSGDGWIRVDSFVCGFFNVTDMEYVGDGFAEVGRMHPMTMYDMLRCIKAESGMEYDRAEFIDKAYRVKPEYWNLWGADTDENTVVAYSQMTRLAEEWEVPVDELLHQLEEIR